MPLFRTPRNDSAKGFRNPRPASTSRPRNPRFAPEFLESRLSPSTIVLSPVSAEVSYTTSQPTWQFATEEPLPTDENGDPIPVPASGDEPGQGAGV